MTLQQASQQLLFQLYHIYEQREAANIADLVMEKVTEWKRIDRVLNKELILSDEKSGLLKIYIDELSRQKPVQYVLKEAWFYGMKLYVDERVLIPRPETEELLDWVLEELRLTQCALQDIEPEAKVKNLKGAGIHLLDVGTGSGCIAIGLKKKLPLAEITACDVSGEALQVARKNGELQVTDLHFIQCDFLNPAVYNDLPRFSVIVSNPPYIPIKEKDTMHANVVQYEPHLALFVEDGDPLIFYRAIAEFAKDHLTGVGQIFMEIHEQLGNAVRDLFLRLGFANITLRKDLQGKERMIRVAV